MIAAKGDVPGRAALYYRSQRDGIFNRSSSSPHWPRIRSLSTTKGKTMQKFPVDAPKARVICALGRLGFRIVREREHIAMTRDNPDGTRTPLTLPNHPRIKASTLRRICTESRIPRDGFLKAFEDC